MGPAVSRKVTGLIFKGRAQVALYCTEDFDAGAGVKFLNFVSDKDNAILLNSLCSYWQVRCFCNLVNCYGVLTVLLLTC